MILFREAFKIKSVEFSTLDLNPKTAPIKSVGWGSDLRDGALITVGTDPECIMIKFKQFSAGLVKLHQ